jgi:hypothetical protein
VVSYRLDNSIKDQIKAFLDGFYDIIPRQLVQIFEPDQLERKSSRVVLFADFKCSRMPRSTFPASADPCGY